MTKGDRVEVHSFGRWYPGEVLAGPRGRIRALIRYTTGSGKTRDRRFPADMIRAPGETKSVKPFPRTIRKETTMTKKTTKTKKTAEKAKPARKPARMSREKSEQQLAAAVAVLKSRGLTRTEAVEYLALVGSGRFLALVKSRSA